MDKIALFQAEENGKEILGCAHQRDYSENGLCVYYSMDKWENSSTITKIEIINDMIVSLINHVEVKDNIKFSDYNRNLN